MSNKVKSIRTQLKMTQKQLAEKVGTSQQQIQRIEAGQTVRHDMALKIIKALDKPAKSVFPEAQKLLAVLSKQDASNDSLPGIAIREAEKSGIDVDPYQWSIRIVFQSGHQEVFQISGSEKSRLWDRLQSEISKTLVFRTPDHHVVLHRDKLMFWQFLFRPPVAAVNDTSGAIHGDELKLELWLDGLSEPETFLMEPDTQALAAENDAEAPIQSLLQRLDLHTDDDDLAYFEDEDGETAFFRIQHLCILKVDIRAVEPAVYRSQGDEDNVVPFSHKSRR